MKRAHWVTGSRCSWFAVRAGAWTIGLAVVWMAASPRVTWGQSAVWQPQNATAGSIYYNGGNVGIGTINPGDLLHLFSTAIAELNVQTSSATGFAALRLTGNTQAWQWATGGSGTGGFANNLYAYNANNGQIPLAITPTGNVGIGTTNPGGPLTVSYAANGQGQLHLVDSSVTNAGNANVGLAGFGSNYGNNYTTQGRTWYIGNPGGSTWAQQFLVWNDRASDTLFGTNATERMRILSNGNVGIGTTNPVYKLSVKGQIGAGEVIVTDTSSWADYVFKPSYRLKPLREVAAYIREHHHLPEIPTEVEVKEKGINVGEIQAKLLAKVEELTLHLIQEHERNDRLEQKLQALEADAYRRVAQPASTADQRIHTGVRK